MPFSIKRFTISRSSSLPAHGGSREKKGGGAADEQQQQQQHGISLSGGRILKKSASQEERKPKHSRTRGLTSSQSVDTADLRRMTYTIGAAGQPSDERLSVGTQLDQSDIIGPPLPDYGDQRFQPPPYSAAGLGLDRHHQNTGARWRQGPKDRRPTPLSVDQRTPFEQASPGDSRKLPAKRNGVRFQDSDIATEESQSTSSSSGGGGGVGGGGPLPRGEYWDEVRYLAKEGRWGNGRRSTRSAAVGPSGREWTPDDSGANGGPRGKRSQQRRHHSAAIGAEPAVVQDSRPRLDIEGGQRNPLYAPVPPPPSSGVYDDDPGIMSEAETSATGFRRGNKVRQTLPVVRTPSKTQDRSLGPVSPQFRQENLTLGLVFLQYRSETKRALLPNEITTLDTVKALFVRSFPKQLTMEYLDSPHIRIYIHDPAKDMFYELEDLRDIRDRSVLRIYEQDINGEGIYSTWEQELSYFSEPEFDSEYQNQHIHRAKNSIPQDGYYGMNAYSPVVARAQTLPHGANLRAFSPLPPEPRTKPPPVVPQVAYAQTLPWGAHIVTYATGPPSPEKRPKEIILPTGMVQPPPKPQRSFQQPPPPIPPPMTKGIRSTPPPTGPPPSIPSPRSSIARPIERRHEPQGAYRPPPPERPYSAGAQPIYSERAALYKSTAYHSPPRYESGYLSSPERRYEPQRAFASYPGPPAPPPSAAAAAAATTPYEEPYYAERIYGTRSGNVTPVVDEEARMRVEYMERQLASLTGLVQKALSTPPPPRPSPTPQYHHHHHQQQTQHFPSRDTSRSDDYFDTKSSKSSSNTSLADDMHESHLESSRHAFKEEKSVSFSDEATTVSSITQKQHSPQHTGEEKPTKPAIKSSSFSSRSLSSDIDCSLAQLLPPTVKVTTADRTERESRTKPAPPPKPASLSSGSSCEGRSPPMRGKIRLSPELYSHLKHLKKQTKDLKLEVRNLRRIAQSQALTAKETVRETCLKIKTMLAAAQVGEEHVCAERLKVSREEDLYRQDVNHLEKDLLDLESQVEELRGNVINRKCRVNLADVEGMALILSRASKSVADLKARFPALQESLKTIMAVEMEVVVREEKFLKDEPERLENALRRCKKLTGTLVTLKRLASVQEQRHTVGHHLPEKSHSAEGPYSDGEVHSAKSSRQGWKRSSNFKEKIDTWRGYSTLGWADQGGSFDGHTVIHVPPDGHQRRGETALDALLSELQTFNLPAEQKRDVIPGLLGPQRRLPSYPSADSPVRSPIHGYGPPSSKSPTPDAKTSNKLQVSASGKSLSPTAQILTERKLSPTSLEVPSRTSPSAKQMLANGPDTAPPLAVKKVPPPPPPRTTSKSPMTSPTAAITTASKQHKATSRGGQTVSYGRSSSMPSTRGSDHPPLRQTASARASSREEPVKESEIIRTSAINDDQPRDQLSSNSSSSESVNSQEGIQAALQAAKLEQSRKAAQQQLINDDDVFKKQQQQQQTLPRNRQELLEQRHQELLRKQKQLQEQYTRLQQMQRGQVFAKHSSGKGDLKKTGSESNILSKASLSLTPASGSMQHLAITGSLSNPIAGGISINSTPNTPSVSPAAKSSAAHGVSSKVFETDIL